MHMIKITHVHAVFCYLHYISVCFFTFKMKRVTTLGRRKTQGKQLQLKVSEFNGVDYIESGSGRSLCQLKLYVLLFPKPALGIMDMSWT